MDFNLTLSLLDSDLSFLFIQLAKSQKKNWSFKLLDNSSEKKFIEFTLHVDTLEYGYLLWSSK